MTRACLTFALSGLLLLSAPLALAGSPADVGLAREDHQQEHEAFLQRGRSGPIGVLFLGDSITAGWKKVPDIWEKNFGAWAPANFGIGGDKTENVIWRIEHGELDGLHPRVVVLLIGTNNSAKNTAPEIVGGIRKIVDEIKARLPETKVLLLAIFPRGPRTTKTGQAEDWESRMAVIKAVNRELPKLADGKRVRFLDVNHVFLAPDGTIPKELMPEQLHPVRAGYERWTAAMMPTLREMMR
ncbi:GDSL family lipase [Horticoccus luteus]|uniref:GDSL family lipase n=1 Tax=Horticoccus luteus TaxID=2862869 RepID=A0A8F9TWY9_9BACT|nr:GDSL-type esterase/lipase family protein [Horticoccus luteus]QYM79082.1 GDSL family lipase [Horticoccus luteus]